MSLLDTPVVFHNDTPAAIPSTAPPMFPHTFDSTMLAAFRSCPQKMFRTYVQHWKPKSESVHLVAGGAFAKGIEVARKVYFEGKIPTYGVKMVEGAYGQVPKTVSTGEQPCEPGDREAAEAAGIHALMIAYGDFECPPDSAKSLTRTAGALEFYFSNYPLGDDGMQPIRLPGGRTGIEFSFAQPLPINHPLTGDPILYTGRSDLIAEFAGGIYIVDEKTASQLGASWARQWEMRGQFTGYQWAAQEALGIKAEGSVIRGVSILKTKYDTLQAVTYRSPYEVNRWLDQTCRDIERAIKAYKDGWWDYAMDGACAEYGGCGLMDVCKSPDPDSWLPMYFEQRVWSPLDRVQMTVEEWEKSWGFEGGVRKP